MQLIYGGFMTLFGFIFYYFFPMSLLYRNTDLFFFLIMFVIFVIFIGMLLIG